MSLFLTSRSPETSLERESGGIPELRLHHGGIIATWRAPVLNKRVKLYLGKEVISEYSIDGPKPFPFGRGLTGGYSVLHPCFLRS